MKKLFKQKSNPKKLLTKTILGVFCFGFIFSIISNLVYADDLLEQAFKPSMNADSLINLGNNKNAVGNEIFKESSEITYGDGDGQLEGGDFTPSVTRQAPLLVRIAKTLLRFTIALAITMILYNGIKYMLEASKGDPISKETLKNIAFIAIGIVLALSSLGIINLISSIGMSSLDGDNTISVTQIGPGCQIYNEFFEKGDPLAKVVCTEELGGTREASKDNEKCNYNGDRQNISENDQKNACEGDLNGYRKAEAGLGCYINNRGVIAGETLNKAVCEELLGGIYEEKSGNMQCKVDNDRSYITQDQAYIGCKNGFGGTIVGE